MKTRYTFPFAGLLFLLLLWACEDQEHSKIAQPVFIEPGSALDFYERGLAEKDLEKKLELYNKGLTVIESTRDTMLPSLLEGKVYALSAMGDKESAAPWIDSLISIAEMQQDSFYIAKGYFRKYKIHFYSNEPVEAFKNAYKSAQVYYQTGDSAWGARRNLDMANIQIDMGDYYVAQESATDALENIDREVDIKYVSSAYNVIGLAYMEQGFNEDAIREYQNALGYAIDRKDSLSYLHNIAIALKNQEKYEQALDILEEVVQFEEPDANSAIRFLDNMAYTKWLADPAFEADSLLLSLLERRRAMNDARGISVSYIHLSEYYADKDPQKATKYADSVLQLSRALPSASLEHVALKKLIDLTPAAESEKLMERFIVLNDSLDQVEKEAKYQFAKIQFDGRLVLRFHSGLGIVNVQNQVGIFFQ